MVKRLVIDDYRTFGFDAEYRRDVFSAYKAIVDEGPWDEIYWDHDMGMWQGDTTIALARFLAVNPDLVGGNPLMYVHSSNPVGAMNLLNTLSDIWETKRVFVVADFPPDYDGLFELQESSPWDMTDEELVYALWQEDEGWQ